MCANHPRGMRRCVIFMRDLARENAMKQAFSTNYCPEDWLYNHFVIDLAAF